MYQYLVKAVKQGIPSAWFYLGVINIEGVWGERDPEMGLKYLVRGAASNSAYCYFYLAMLYAEGRVVEKNPRLEFLYVKRAAEEGFVQMQHNLGILYHEGRLVKKNDKLALAWLRESVRNGYIPSYQLAGDILYEGSHPSLPPERSVKQNRMFALSQYLGAYQNGALFLEHQIRKVIEELHTIEGYSKEVLPDIRYVVVP
jgi:TPR repeat protein